MADDIPAIDPADIWAQVQRQHALRAGLAESVLASNKTAVFDALASAGITCVEIVFDGSGDSGQIESVTARAGETPADLPAVEVAIATPIHDGSGLNHLTVGLGDAIEELAYGFLEETHGGWEINEGAFGEFTFDVAERSIELGYNERIETSEYHAHSW